MRVYVCVCVCARARACVRACVCARARALSLSQCFNVSLCLCSATLCTDSCSGDTIACLNDATSRQLFTKTGYYKVNVNLINLCRQSRRSSVAVPCRSLSPSPPPHPHPHLLFPLFVSVHAGIDMSRMPVPHPPHPPTPHPSFFFPSTLREVQQMLVKISETQMILFLSSFSISSGPVRGSR